MKGVQMDNNEYRGLESKNSLVVAPPVQSIDMTAYRGSNIPNNWEITAVTGDILMVEYADSPDKDGEYVDRGGVLINTAITPQVWRVGRIVKAGPGASQFAKEGAFVMFPNDKGIPLTKFNNKNYIFLNEQRIFAYVTPKSL